MVGKIDLAKQERRDAREESSLNAESDVGNGNRIRGSIVTSMTEADLNFYNAVLFSKMGRISTQNKFGSAQRISGNFEI